jgi:hypothetical protein
VTRNQSNAARSERPSKWSRRRGAKATTHAGPSTVKLVT